MQTQQNQDFQAFRVNSNSSFSTLIDSYEQEHDLFKEQQRVNRIEARAQRKFIKAFKGVEHAHTN